MWDDELEMLALANVVQCQMEHDHCRRTQRYRSPGQNLYSQWTLNKDAIDDQYIKLAVHDSIKSWFEEYKLVTNFRWITSFAGDNDPWWKIGHFTQMIWSDASAIGCSIVKDQNYIYIACNYASGNMMGSSVWDIGPTGSQCKTSMHPKYPGLCGVGEFRNDGKEAPPVTKWIENEKNLTGKNSSAMNKSVGILIYICYVGNAFFKL